MFTYLGDFFVTFQSPHPNDTTHPAQVLCVFVTSFNLDRFLNFSRVTSWSTDIDHTFKVYVFPTRHRPHFQGVRIPHFEVE